MPRERAPEGRATAGEEHGDPGREGHDDGDRGERRQSAREHRGAPARGDEQKQEATRRTAPGVEPANQGCGRLNHDGEERKREQQRSERDDDRDRGGEACAERPRRVPPCLDPERAPTP